MPTKHPSLTIPSLVELMEAGTHFGHKKHRSFPSARKYVFTIRDRVLVINLEDTRRQLADACDYLTERARSGATMLLVGTKRQASALIKELGEALEQPYIHQRWLGGTLTNFETIQKRLKRLRDLEGLVASDAFITDHTKKERAVLERELARLQRTLGGLKRLTRIPDVLVIVDTDEESNALSEARRLKVPVVAIVDTNADPDAVTKPIVANDDSAKAVSLILTTLRHAIEQGRGTPVAAAAASKIVNQDSSETTATESTSTPAVKTVKEKRGAKKAVKPTAKRVAAKKAATKTKKPTE